MIVLFTSAKMQLNLTLRFFFIQLAIFLNYRNAPYIEVPFPKEIIKEITIGPLLKDKIALNTVIDLLKSRGYDSVEVLNSNIPIRY